MPLKRTPPIKSPSEKMEKLKPASRETSQSGSTLNLNEPDIENVSNRYKRKRTPELPLLDEFRTLLSAHTAQTDSKLADIQLAMREVITQNTEIKESMSFISRQYDDLMKKLSSLETERAADGVYIQQLEQKVEYLERSQFSTCIELKNIPKITSESKENLKQMAIEISHSMKTPIQCHEIKDIFRMGNKDESPIVIDFVSVATKETVIKKARQLKKQLNTSYLKLEGPSKPVYISERLTARTRRIFHLARNFAKEKGFKYCWTSHGKVFLRQNEGKKHYVINCDADFKKVSLS